LGAGKRRHRRLVHPFASKTSCVFSTQLASTPRAVLTGSPTSSIDDTHTSNTLVLERIPAAAAVGDLFDTVNRNSDIVIHYSAIANYSGRTGCGGLPLRDERSARMLRSDGACVCGYGANCCRCLDHFIRAGCGRAHRQHPTVAALGLESGLPHETTQGVCCRGLLGHGGSGPARYQQRLKNERFAMYGPLVRPSQWPAYPWPR